MVRYFCDVCDKEVKQLYKSEVSYRTKHKLEKEMSDNFNASDAFDDNSVSLCMTCNDELFSGIFKRGSK